MNNKVKFIVLIANFLFNLQNITAKWQVWEKELEWWQTSIIYQIYPKSFQDSDGDGSGDLKGIQSRLDHFVESGIRTVWLSPIFKSPMADLGYDISNFTAVDESYGSLDDFKDLVKAIKERGMYLLMDFVPNHTSDEHDWFKKSIKRIPPYTDYYVWKDGELAENGTYLNNPNNWLSLFGGSGWKYVPERGQFYYHQFNEKQPELNHYNVLVQKEMKDIMKFWLDLGVDGFRMDAVKHLTEDPTFQNESYYDPVPPRCNGNEYCKMKHNLTTDWPYTYDLIYDWRKFMDEYKENATEKHTRIMLTEAYSDINHTMLYYTNGTNLGAHSPFNFLLLGVSIESNSTVLKNLINVWFDNIPDGFWPNWVTGNHDNHRVAARVGEDMVDAINMLSMLLPGTAVTYQGEEIGQPDTMVRKDQIRDPNNNGGGAADVRDPERGPFLWDDTKNAGFTNKKVPWEPVHPSYWKLNLKNQKLTEKSHYKIYKRLSELRATATIQRGSLEVDEISTWVFSLVRRLPGNETYVVVMNLGSEIEIIFLGDEITNLPEFLTISVASINSGYNEGDTIQTKVPMDGSTRPLILRPKSSVVLVSFKEDPTTTTSVSPPKNGTTTPTNKPTNSASFSHANKYYICIILLIAVILTAKNMF